MAQLLSKIISAWPQVVKRSLAHWRLLSSVIVGVLLASTIMAGTVIYFDALRELALKNSLSKLTVNETNVLVKADRGPTNIEEYNKVRDATIAQVDPRLGWLLRDTIRGGKSSTFFLTQTGLEEFAGEDNHRAFFAFLPRLLEHIDVVEGRLPQEQAIPSAEHPFVLEALVPADAAREFDLSIGDSLSAVPFWRDMTPYGNVVVSGIFERKDPSNEFWHLNDTVFNASTASSFRTVSFYISEVTYMQVLGDTFRDMDSTYGWLLEVDPNRLTAENSTITRLQLNALRRQLNTTLFSYRQITSLDRALSDYDQRLFFSKIPMFVVLVLIAVVILYYVVTLSSLLVDQQRGEVALMRSRGASPGQILAVFVLEGMTISILAIIVGPLLAAAVISFLGITPAFADLSGGDSLRVSISGGAYLMSVLGGVLSFSALIIPAVQASRVEVTQHRNEASRPVTEPFFQRYYLDVMLLIVSVILFRQLSEQGSVVAVGLFGDVAVDQVLLVVPALILIAFAMVLLRLFPLAIRYLSGDSPSIVHLIAYVSVLLLVPAILIREVMNDARGLWWIVQVASLVGVGVAYWFTTRNETPAIKTAGLVVQAILVTTVILVGPQLPLHQIFVPILIAIVPAQIIFILLKAFSHFAPVGFSMGLWQMARNPTHYARLSLLLILMSGLGIFAASFGGTLERSFQERAFYSTGADVRLEGVLINTTGPSRSVEGSYLEIQGVHGVSPVIRGFGTDLSRLLGESYTMVSINGDAVREIGWFRDDFSQKPMGDLLSELPHRNLPQGLALPEDARAIGIRLKADRPHPSVMVTARILDSNDRYFTYNLGTLDTDEWVELESNLIRGNGFGNRPPLQPEQPFTLVALAVHELNGRNRLRSGSIVIDEFYVKSAPNQSISIEPFSELSEWNLLKVTPQSITDVFGESTVQYNGDSGAALFVWSEGSPLTSRGIFHGPPVTPVPVLASKSFLRETGHSLGEQIEVSVRGHRVQVLLTDTIDFFPTLDTFNESYLISDLYSLRRYANLDATASELRPNEIWVGTNVDGPDRQILLDTFSKDTPFLHRQVTDRVNVLAESQVDPLVEAGWRSLLFIAFGAVLILSCLGFLVHSYVSFRNREVQFALMRTIGFSMGQLTTLVWLEQMLVIIAGLALGTWMGGRLGAIIMPFLAHNDRGSQVLPPFILQVNWVTLAITYSAMVFVFAIIILGMILFIRRISLQRILRLGEM